VDRELVRYQQAVAKLVQQREEAVAKEQAKVIPVLAAAARAAVRQGDMATAGATWKQILVLDRDQPDAVAYFTSLGQLTQVLAELEGDPLAPTAPVSASAAQAVEISAAPGGQPAFTGITKGTTLTFTYQDGTWTFFGSFPQASPDSEPDERFRLALFTTAEGAAASPERLRPIGIVRVGTAQEPMVWTAPRDIDRIWLGIHRQREPVGQVRYRIDRRDPEAPR
jgi:hypothetical protein